MDEYQSLVDMVERSCASFAARPLFGQHAGKSWTWTTYAQFQERVAHARAGLHALNVDVGDRVALIVKNCEPWAVTACAAHGLGAAIVPMYESQRPDEWAYILADSGAKLLLAKNAAIAASVREHASQLPALAHIVVIEAPRAATDSFEAMLQDGTLPARRPDPQEIASFVYTSGTTGRPKGVLLSHANIVSNLNGVRQVFSFEPDDRSLSFLPWAHAFGQVAELYMLMSMGCSIAINQDLSRLVDEMREVQPTVLFAVPRLFNKLFATVHEQLDHEPELLQHVFDDSVQLSQARAHGAHLTWRERAELALTDKLLFSRIRHKLGGKLKYAISASAALNPQVAEFVSAMGIPVYEGYGLTETSPIVSCNRPGATRVGSVGQPIPGVRVIVDASKGASDGSGELVVYGPNVMRGYHNRPEETAQAITPDGGLRTGDLGRIDEDGYVYITGRIKEQYKLANGKYVMPVPLEEQLKLSGLITNVLLYGADREFNVALVVPNEPAVRARAADLGLSIGGDLSRSELALGLIQRELDELGAGFAPFERPRKCMLLEADFSIENGLLTPTLKVRRAAVIERYRSGIDGLYREPPPAHAPL